MFQVFLIIFWATIRLQSNRIQRVEKVFDFFARFKNATFFVKTGFHEKSRYARQKA